MIQVVWSRAPEGLKQVTCFHLQRLLMLSGWFLGKLIKFSANLCNDDDD